MSPEGCFYAVPKLGVPMVIRSLPLSGSWGTGPCRQRIVVSAAAREVKLPTGVEVAGGEPFVAGRRPSSISGRPIGAGQSPAVETSVWKESSSIFVPSRCSSTVTV